MSDTGNSRDRSAPVPFVPAISPQSRAYHEAVARAEAAAQPKPKTRHVPVQWINGTPVAWREEAIEEEDV